MAYTVVFDVVQSGYRQWPFLLIGLTFVVMTGWLFVIQRKLPPNLHIFPAGYGLGFSIIWTLIAFVGTFKDYVRLSSALRAGKCQVTEGVVIDFHPSPYATRQKDWFTLNGHRFEYADNIATAGFNQTESHGGPVHQGVQVRIHYVENEIARLEVVR